VSATMKRGARLFGLLVGLVALTASDRCLAQQTPGPAVKRLTLDEAIQLARAHNRTLRVAQLKVTETEAQARQARANYYPQLTADGYYVGAAETQNIVVPVGALGSVAGAPFPTLDATILQGGTALFLATGSVTQPLTQLWRIGAGYHAAQADVGAAAADVGHAVAETDFGVEQAYIGLLVATRRRDAARVAVAAAEAQLHVAETAVGAGTTLAATAQATSAEHLQREHDLLTLENEVDDLTNDLNELLGLPLETSLELAPVPAAPEELGTADTYLQKALAGNPDLRAAGARIAKARAGESAARSAYIPDVGAYGQYVHQSGVPFLPRDNFIFGVRGSWTIFDFGKREGAVAERRAQLAEALEDSSRVRNRVESEVRKSWRKLERALQMRQVATEALVARREATRLQRDTTQVGFAIEAQAAQAHAEQAKGEADLFAAELGVRLAWAGVRRAAGLPSAASR
jgi:outer membrane protein TolC